MRAILIAGSLACIAAAGCSDDHHDGGCGLEANCTADQVTYSDGLVVAGDEGLLELRVVSASPNPPDPTEPNTWTVEVLDGQGARVAGASLTRINTWSVDCGHFGVEGPEGLDLTDVDNGDGTFTFTFHYAHGGPWDVEVDVSDGTNSDTARVGLCLEETGEHGH